VLLGRAVGLPEAKIAHLRDEPLPEDVYSDVERTVVRYARASTRMERIDDDLFAELTSHFELTAVIELCFVVGLSNVVNRFHATFHTDVDDATRAALAGGAPVPLPPEPRRPSDGG